MTIEKKEFDVVADILRVAALGSKEPELIMGCALGRNSFEKYLTNIVALKLVNVEQENANFYQTTEKGLEVLRFYHVCDGYYWQRRRLCTNQHHK